MRRCSVLSLAWDFALSLVLRAVFTAALVGGVNFLAWSYDCWQTEFWKNEQHRAAGAISFILAGAATAVGMLGTFRGGRDERNFSATALASIAAGASLGHVHASPHTGARRTLRRFPAVESCILGGTLVSIWLIVWASHAELWPMRLGAIVGAVQIAWGVLQRAPQSSAPM